MKILLAEDDVQISKSLKELLTKESYLVDVTYDGEEAIYFAENDSYDLIILDVMMPKKNGYEVTKHIRELKINTPILILTAKGTTLDKVTGLDCGADDYLIKPFITEELFARIRALTRRVGEVVLNELTYKDLTIDLNNYTISSGDKSTGLSKTEFDLLKLFIQNSSQCFSKEQIIVKIWGYDSDIEENNVEVYISFLRKKLKYIKTNIEIKTLRKIGYCLGEKNSD